MLYHPAMYDTGRPARSWWEDDCGPATDDAALASDVRCDVAIIGGGYTGLSTALHLARDHGIDAVGLEAGPLGWGASCRNGGFCCLGSAKLPRSKMIAAVGEDETVRFDLSQREAVELVETLAAEEGFDLGRHGEGVLEVAHRPSRAAGFPDEVDWLRRRVGVEAEAWSASEARSRAFTGPEVHGGLMTNFGFGLHPLMMHRGLVAAARRRGARLHGQSRVTGWERGPGGHRLVTQGGTVTARHVVIATNGYTIDALHPYLAGTYLPAISSIVVTRPLTDDERAAQGWKADIPIFDSRILLGYFRMLADGRFLFGARGDDWGSPGRTQAWRGIIEARLARTFPAWAGVETTHYWGGLVCLSANLTPLLGQVPDDPGVWYGLAYHGNGVAYANWTGRALADLIAGRRRWGVAGVPAIVSRPPRRFPLPPWRRRWLQAAYAWYRVADAL